MGSETMVEASRSGGNVTPVEANGTGEDRGEEAGQEAVGNEGNGREMKSMEDTADGRDAEEGFEVAEEDAANSVPPSTPAKSRFGAVKDAILEMDEELEDQIMGAAEGIWKFASVSFGKMSTAARDTRALESVKQGVVGNALMSVTSSVQKESESVQTALQSSVENHQDRVVPQELDIQQEFATLSESVTGTLGKVHGLFGGLWGTTASSNTQQASDHRFEKETRRSGSYGHRAASLPPSLDRHQKKVRELQANSDIYCNPPPDEEAFDRWRGAFNIAEKANEIAAVLQANPEIEALQQRIVPRLVEDDVFWSRYFFALDKLETEERRRLAILEKQSKAAEEEDFAWSDNEDEEVENVNEKETGGEVSDREGYVCDGPCGADLKGVAAAEQTSQSAEGPADHSEAVDDDEDEGDEWD